MRNTDTATFTKPDGTTVELSTGCIFDGAYGWHNGTRVYWLARDLGFGADWPADDAARTDEAVESFDDGRASFDQEDEQAHAVEMAEDFLQAGLDDAHYFTWDDGFYLFHVEDDFDC